MSVLLVNYSDLAGWFREHGQPFAVGNAVGTFIVTPLQVNQDLSFFGAAALLLIAGFAIAATAAAGGAARLAVRQGFRIVPLMVLAVLLAIAGARTWHRLPNAGILLAVVSVFLLAWISFAIFGGEPWIAVAVQITLCSVALSVVGHVVPSGLRAWMIFGLTAVLGQVIWLVHARHVPPWAGAMLGVACWVVFVWADQAGIGRGLGEANPLTLAYATVLVAIAVQVRSELATGSICSWVTSRSYALLLVAPGCGALMLSRLPESFIADVRAALSVCVAALLSEAVYRAMDGPAQRLAGLLVRGPDDDTPRAR